MVLRSILHRLSSRLGQADSKSASPPPSPSEIAEVAALVDDPGPQRGSRKDRRRVAAIARVLAKLPPEERALLRRSLSQIGELPAEKQRELGRAVARYAMGRS